jgi:hypothetical protein
VNEGREKAPVRVSSEILGGRRDLANVTAYAVRDAAGEAVFVSIDVVAVQMFLGSRLEH